MPRAAICRLSTEISVEKALVMRDGDKALNDLIIEFRCVECGMPVRPHKKSENMDAHFEHLRRNPNCALSDPLR